METAELLQAEAEELASRVQELHRKIAELPSEEKAKLSELNGINNKWNWNYGHPYFPVKLNFCKMQQNWTDIDAVRWDSANDRFIFVEDKMVHNGILEEDSQYTVLHRLTKAMAPGSKFTLMFVKTLGAVPDCCKPKINPLSEKEIIRAWDETGERKDFRTLSVEEVLNTYNQ